MAEAIQTPMSERAEAAERVADPAEVLSQGAPRDRSSGAAPCRNARKPMAQAALHSRIRKRSNFVPAKGS